MFQSSSCELAWPSYSPEGLHEKNAEQFLIDSLRCDAVFLAILFRFQMHDMFLFFLYLFLISSLFTSQLAGLSQIALAHMLFCLIVCFYSVWHPSRRETYD